MSGDGGVVVRIQRPGCGVVVSRPDMRHLSVTESDSGRGGLNAAAPRYAVWKGPLGPPETPGGPPIGVIQPPAHADYRDQAAGDLQGSSANPGDRNYEPPK